MKKYEISIIVPTLNEAENLPELIARIHNTLSPQVAYQVIIVDDHSTDNTKEVVAHLSQTYPISFYEKKGRRGKAYSLLEGFTYADASILAFIDADLQYPPEAIHGMYQKISQGADVVVSERKTNNAPLLRKLSSKTFRKIFVHSLHKLPYDTQSGLKLFKNEVIRRLNLSPSQWSFDLEFLLKARHAGYKIASVPIEFANRKYGSAKVNVLKVTIELALNSLALKLRDIEPIPLLKEDIGNGFHYRGKKYVHHSNLQTKETAFFRLNRKQKTILLTLCLLLLFALIANWHLTIILFLLTLSTLYLLDIFFNLFLITRSFSKKPEIKVKKDEIENIPEEQWPTYTIFCPLYKEWQVVPQFVTAMSRLDYPKKKLQVQLLLEEDDEETLEKIRTFDLPDYFEVIVVPDSLPKTKPKACNYGLKKATGEYCVIYDAEDVPDPKQLKKAVLAFHKSGDKTVCVQAKLNFYNPHHNLLTRIFTAEYSLWFDLVLTGLQSIHAPIPLGGTSNHFRVRDLVQLKGWDAFNVTEDCDLGIRLAKKGYFTAMVDSTTHEEANSSFQNWVGQRSRWIKGYIQSYFVHMRDVTSFRESGSIHFFYFQFIVGGKILSMLINPALWLLTISYFAFRSQLGPFIESLFPGPVLYIGVISLVVGNFLYFYYYMIGCAKRGNFELIPYGFFVPFYWLMMSFACWIALYKMITQPHYWFKTKHGLHLSSEKAVNQAQSVLGNQLVDAHITDQNGFFDRERHMQFRVS